MTGQKELIISNGRMHVWTRLSKKWENKSGCGLYADGMRSLGAMRKRDRISPAKAQSMPRATLKGSPGPPVGLQFLTKLKSNKPILGGTL
jgi:hypothetical protein